MTDRPQLLALLLLTATLTACGDKDATDKPRASAEPMGKLEPKFFPFELGDLERLRVPRDAPDASTPGHARMTEEQVVAFFEKIAQGNTCTWGGFKRARGGGDSCTPMRMSCELPHAFSIGEVNAKIKLEVERKSCSSPFLLKRVRMRAAGDAGRQLVGLLKERFGPPQFVDLETNWAEHRWTKLEEGLPDLVVMELNPQ